SPYATLDFPASGSDLVAVIVAAIPQVCGSLIGQVLRHVENLHSPADIGARRSLVIGRVVVPVERLAAALIPEVDGGASHQVEAAIRCAVTGTAGHAIAVGLHPR